MRYVAHLAALIGLAAFGVALGDYVSNPNLLGTFGLFALMMALGLALGQLYRPGGWGSARPAAARTRKPVEAKPAPVAVPEPEEPLWSGKQDKPTTRRRRPQRPNPTADAGWDAREAESSRERRREERQARKRNR